MPSSEGTGSVLDGLDNLLIVIVHYSLHVMKNHIEAWPLAKGEGMEMLISSSSLLVSLSLFF